MIKLHHDICNMQTTSNHNIAPENKTELTKEWERWSKEGGEGESRDIAFRQLEACLYNHTSELDLTDLNLTSLPKNLPPHILKLSICNNNVTQLPSDLPNSLIELTAKNNRLTEIPENFPSVKILDISHNQFTTYPQHLLSKQLLSFNISENPLTHFSEDLSSSTISFTSDNDQSLPIAKSDSEIWRSQLYREASRVSKQISNEMSRVSDRASNEASRTTHNVENFGKKIRDRFKRL